MTSTIDHDLTAGVLARTAAIIAETGATDEEAEALTEITRIIIDSGDPAGAARQLLDVIQRDAERQLDELGVRVYVADGPAADKMDDAVFLTELVDGRRVVVVPPGWEPRNVLIRVKSMLAAMGSDR